MFGNVGFGDKVRVVRFRGCGIRMCSLGCRVLWIPDLGFSLNWRLRFSGLVCGGVGIRLHIACLEVIDLECSSAQTWVCLCLKTR